MGRISYNRDQPQPGRRPKNRNTPEEPEKVCAVKGTDTGAKKGMEYETKAWSFTVLKLKKAFPGTDE